MAENAEPAPAPPGLPKPKRPRRWPTVVVTTLLTLVAAYLAERYFLPTQAWWVAHNRSRHPWDEHYLDEVLRSKSLSPAAKVQLICEVCRPTVVGLNCRNWLVKNWGYVAQAITAVLSDRHASTGSLWNALWLLQSGVEMCAAEDLSQNEIRGIRGTITNSVCPSLNQLTNRPGLSRELRNHAVIAWSGIGTGRDLQRSVQLEYHFPTDVLIQCLSDPDEDVRGNAARALGLAANRDDTHKVITALLEAYETEPTRPLIANRDRILGRLVYATEPFSEYESLHDSLGGLQPKNYARLEMVYSLGQYVETADDSDAKLIHQTLFTLLQSSRPPFPSPVSPELPHDHKDRKTLANDPWFDDQFLRAEAILALLPYRSRAKYLGTSADSTVLATLKQWTPECPWTDFAVQAAAVYLSSCDHPDAVPTLLEVFRKVNATCIREFDQWKKQEESRGDWATTPKARLVTLVTLMEALASHPSLIPHLTSEFASTKPFLVEWSTPPFHRRQPLQTRLRSRTDPNLPYVSANSRWCPGPRVAWWRPVQESGEKWWSLPRCLKRVTPPSKEDLPRLRAQLDYNGNGTTEDQALIQQVQQEAARALLRNATDGVQDRREVVGKILRDPTSHRRLQLEAENLRRYLPPPSAK